MSAGLNKSFDLLFECATIVVLTFLFVLDKRNTLWLRDMVRQTTHWEASGRRADGRSASKQLLTSRAMSASPYRVTTKYSYHIEGVNTSVSWTCSLFPAICQISKCILIAIDIIMDHNTMWCIHWPSVVIWGRITSRYRKTFNQWEHSCHLSCAPIGWKA